MSKLTDMNSLLKRLYSPEVVLEVVYGPRKPRCKHGRPLGECGTSDPECVVQEVMES